MDGRWGGMINVPITAINMIQAFNKYLVVSQYYKSAKNNFYENINLISNPLITNTTVTVHAQQLETRFFIQLILTHASNVSMAPRGT